MKIPSLLSLIHIFTELDRSKIEEQKKAVRSGYDMDIIPSDLATYGKEDVYKRQEYFCRCQDAVWHFA